MLAFVNPRSTRKSGNPNGASPRQPCKEFPCELSYFDCRISLANYARLAYMLTMKSLDIIASEALLLPKDQRFTLAHRILASVEPEVEAAVEAAWDMEIRERIKKYDADPKSGVPGRDVFSELDKKLRR